MIRLASIEQCSGCTASKAVCLRDAIVTDSICEDFLRLKLGNKVVALLVPAGDLKIKPFYY